MFGGGGGGLDPRKMEQMMKQMGIDVDELDVSEVIIRTDDGDLVFDDPEVTKMDARGQETYQVLGSPTKQEAAIPDADDTPAIPEEDIQTVVDRTGASEDAAREALEANDGDLIAAVADLE